MAKAKTGSTTKELVEELEALKQTPAVLRMIGLARRGEYHDFLTTFATPKMELVEDLKNACKVEGGENAPKLRALVEAVKRGEFDGEGPSDRLGPEG